MNSDNVFIQNISNLVQELGYSSTKIRKKFILTEDHINERLKFCRKMIKQNNEYLSLIKRSDEW